MLENNDIRQALKDANIFYWQLANEVGCAESSIYRWMRTELPEAKKTIILNAITSIVSRKQR